MVSCGFDAMQNDPLGKLQNTAAIYWYMTEQLKQLGVPIVAALEGGYDVHNL
jgi:acetoin utilization deacetylase AcuC-like enzyme